MVHTELYRLARRYMGQERAGHLLQPTALVNEAYMRLINWKNVEWKNRAHFFGVSAQLMRRILVDFARQRPRLAGNTAPHVSLDEDLTVRMGQSDDMVALDDALSNLAKMDERKSRIVEMRFFGGLSNEEIAEVLEISLLPKQFTRNPDRVRRFENVFDQRATADDDLRFAASDLRVAITSP